MEDFDEKDILYDTKASLKEFERMIIRACIFKPQFRLNAIPKINPSYFDDDYYVHIFKKIKDFYLKNTSKEISIPNRDIIKTELKQDDTVLKIFSNRVDSLFDHVDNLFTYEEINEPWITEKAEIWVKRNGITAVSFDIFDALQKDGTKLQKTNSVDKLIPRLEEAVKVSLKPTNFYDLSDFSLIEKYVHKLEHGLDLVKTSLTTIMDMAGNNLKRGTSNIVIGGTGAGKSNHLMAHFIGAIDKGYNSLYVSFELTEDDLLSRYMSNVYNVKSNDSRDKAMKSASSFVDTLRKRHKELYQKPRGKEFLVSFNAQEYGVRDVDVYLKNLQSVYGIKIDCVIFDYLGKMKPSSNLGGDKNSQEWQRLITVSNEIDDFSKSNNLMSWTAMQLKPESKQNETITEADIATSKGVLFPISFAYAFVAQKGKNIHKCFILKSRHDKNKEIFVLGFDSEYQRIYDIDQSNLQLESTDIEIIRNVASSNNSKKELPGTTIKKSGSIMKPFSHSFKI